MGLTLRCLSSKMLLWTIPWSSRRHKARPSHFLLASSLKHAAC